MEVVNNLGIERNKLVKKEVLRLLIIGPIFSLIMIFLTYVSMKENLLFFYTTLPFHILLMIVLFFIAPFNMLNRHNKTIYEIGLKNGFLYLKTFGVLWKDSKIVNIKLDDVKVKYKKFRHYGKEEYEGIELFVNKTKSFYLVYKYFSNIGEIIVNLNKN